MINHTGPASFGRSRDFVFSCESDQIRQTKYNLGGLVPGIHTVPGVNAAAAVACAKARSVSLNLGE
jgi:hypothetical protein